MPDIFAAFAELVGNDRVAKGGEDSVSMLPLLLGKERRDKRTSVIHHRGSPVFSLRSKDWKLIYDTRSEDQRPSPDAGRWEIFNITDDWLEKDDRWKNEIDTVHEMITTLKSEIEV